MKSRIISLIAVTIIVIMIMSGLSVWADTSVEQTEVEYSDIAQIENLDDAESSEEAVKSTAKRIIVVASQIEDNYGADAEYLMPYGEIVLEYSSAQKADYAYKKLSSKYECYKDEFIDVSIESEQDPEQVSAASDNKSEQDPAQVSAASDNKSEQDPAQVGAASDNQSYITISDAIKSNLGMNNLKQDKLKRGVTVAILDTGLSDASSVFAGRVSNQGYDFIENTANLTDPSGHGTHVAGIVAMNTPSNVKILPIRMLTDNDSTGSSLLMISAALRYAVSNGADIINMSLDLSSASQSALRYLDSIIEDAYDNGIICCVAAGNDGIRIKEDNYPACIGEAITVSAIENNGDLCNFSNYGVEVDFAAPGRNITSASTNGKTAVMSGTSQAAPFISACFAYVIGSGEYDSSLQYINALKNSCLELGETGRDAYFGWGLPYLVSGQPAQHHYKKTIVTKATCTTDGVARYTCTDAGCSDEYTETIPATGHEWILSSDTSNGGNASGTDNTHPVCSICKTVFQGTAEGQLTDSASWKIVTTGVNSSGNYLLRLEITGTGAIPDAESYPWDAFRNQIAGIILDDGITSIGSHAFEKMTFLDSIRHGTTFEESANGFPDSLTSIGELAFYNCLSLTEIKIPEKMSTLGDGAFAGCNNLTSFVVEPSNTSFSSLEEENYRNLYNQDQSVLYVCSDEAGTFSDKITEIAPYAFYKKKITSIRIGPDIAKIGDKAFAGCSSLTDVNINRDNNIDIAGNVFENDIIDMNVEELYYDDWMDIQKESYGGIISVYMDNFTPYVHMSLEKSVFRFALNKNGGLPDYKPEVISDNYDFLEDESYIVRYYNNRTPGIATVVVRGVENIHGVIRLNFTINKGVVDINNVSDNITMKVGDTYIPSQLESEYISYHFKTEDDTVLSVSPDGREVTSLQCNATNGSTQTKLGIIIDENDYFVGGNCKNIAVKLEHNYKLFKTEEPTYASNGYKRYTCVACGNSYDKAVQKLSGAKQGSCTTVAGINYKVLSNSSNTVQVTKLPKKRTVVIPASIKINGKKYNVSSIGAKACYKNTAVSSITIGCNVKSVGKNAFYGCKKLKTIKFMRSGSTSFGSKSLYSINKSAVVSVKARYYKIYIVRLRKAGLNSSKQKVKKLYN